MKFIQKYAPEHATHKDRISGTTIRRLTNWKGHSTHPYFTEDGWYDNDTKLLFLSDRNNAKNIFSVDIPSGEIYRLTDFDSTTPDLTCPLSVNKRLNEIYYMHNRVVTALNLETLETRPIYTVPEGFKFGGARVMADGKYVIGSLGQDLAGKVVQNLSAGYIGMNETFKAKPDTRIVRINVETGESDEIWQEYCWVGHINPSPTQPNLLTFCHEGPWHLVDNRIWVLDTNTGKAIKIRERKQEGELIGHEYWLADGIHIGYQVHSPQHTIEDGGRGETWFGFVKYDNTGELEPTNIKVPRETPDHIHSRDFGLVVCDSGKAIKGYKYDGKAFSGPRIICMHDGSFFWGGHHPHPRITNDGKHIVYNSTNLGYCNIFMAEVPQDFDSLPLV